MMKAVMNKRENIKQLKDQNGFQSRQTKKSGKNSKRLDTKNWKSSLPISSRKTLRIGMTRSWQKDNHCCLLKQMFSTTVLNQSQKYAVTGKKVKKKNKTNLLSLR